MKLYVASSWRNVYQPDVVKALEKNGHEVYDFRANGFSWKSVNSGWETWTPAQYLAGLSHPAAEAGFKRDFDAMKWAEGCIYLMPCGVSAALEAGWFIGQRKLTICYIPGIREPDLMVKMADLITESFDEVLEACAVWTRKQV